MSTSATHQYAAKSETDLQKWNLGHIFIPVVQQKTKLFH